VGPQYNPFEGGTQDRPWSELLKDAATRLVDIPAGYARGAVTGTLGLPGDIEELIRKHSGDLEKFSPINAGIGALRRATDSEPEKPDPTPFFRTTDLWNQDPSMPPVREGQKPGVEETIGQVTGVPIGVGGAVRGGARAVEGAKDLLQPSIDALKVTPRAITPADQASRRTFLKGGTAAALGGGVLGTEAVVRALRKETKPQGWSSVDTAVEKELPHWSRGGRSVRGRVEEKTLAHHAAEGYADPETFGQAHTPPSIDDYLTAGRQRWPDRSDDEILHTYERLLDTQAGSTAKFGTKEVPKADKETFGVGRYDTTTGKWDETEADWARKIINGEVNPADYKKNEFLNLDWGNTDHWDDWNTLKGHIKEDSPKAPWLQRLEQGQGTPQDSSNYYKNLDTPANKAKPQSAAEDPDAAAKAVLMASTLRDPMTAKAKKLLDEGMHPEGVWRVTGRERVPGAPENRFMKEIPDTDAHIKPGPWFDNNGGLTPGWYKLDSMMHHPELFDKLPQFKDTRVSIGPMQEGVSGSFQQDLNRMNLNSDYFNKYTMNELMGTVLHEIQHPLQKQFGWPRGSNVDSMNMDTSQLIGLQHIKNRGPHPEKRQELLNIIDALGGKNFPLYHNTFGEQQAEVTNARRFLTHQELADIPPSSMYAAPHLGFDIKDYRKLQKEASRTYEQLPPMTAAEIKALHEGIRKGPKRAGDLEPPVPGGGTHPKHTENIIKMTGGKKSRFDELTDDELNKFFDQGLDEGIQVN
jgi:hypothetical protein